MARPAWTLTEAAEHCGVSRSTTRRYREKGKFPNAFIGQDGKWRVPLEDLLAAGLKPGKPTEGYSESEQPSPPAPDLSAEVAALQAQLEVERVKRQAAEALAHQAQENLADVRLALRMLEGRATRPEPAQEVVQEPVQSAPAEPAPTAPERPEPAPSQRQRWWRRR